MSDQSATDVKGKGDNFPFLTSCSYNLYHVPYFTSRYGTGADGSGLAESPDSLRSFEDVCAYPPNQAFVGNLDPKELPPRPWCTVPNSEGTPSKGPFGDILTEKMLYGLIKHSDVFDLVKMESSFAAECKTLFQQNSLCASWDLSSFDKSCSVDEIQTAIDEGALPLQTDGALVGCVVSAHPSDKNLTAHTILENLSSKASAVYAVCRLLDNAGIDPEEIDYIIETSEEACGDMNQRGGGNFAKAIGELAGLKNATGSDVRSFCAGPVHGIVLAASLVKAQTFRRVIVAAGGTTAKLAMNARKHIKKGVPVLEDCMGSFALLIEAESRDAGSVLLRTDAVGIHRIGSGAAPQAVIQDLVVNPVFKAGYRLSEIDYYAPELQNPEITENAGAGNVTEANLKMIAAMAVMKKEIERAEIPDFIKVHGSQGWAPTQGHIPSGVPAFGWLLKWSRENPSIRSLVIGKGSLFLGRMTSLFDGISIIAEGSGVGASGYGSDVSNISAESFEPPKRVGPEGDTRIGLTVPGFEGGREELERGSVTAMEESPNLEVVLYGTESAHADMTKDLETGKISGAVTFHYPFPIGVATVGHLTANGKDMFLSSTTGTSAIARIPSLVRNAVYGIVAAKGFGIENPTVGFLNLDGAAIARKIFSRIIDQGYRARLIKSFRGDELLRGNDILSGGPDVLVCDSLTGNVITKMLASFSSSGSIETEGSGYGPGIGDFPSLVCIVSRASSGPVVRDALLLAEKYSAVDLLELYKMEMAAAKAAGLDDALAEYTPSSAKAGPSAKAGLPKVPKKVVNSEIEGIDVLSLEDAVALLLTRNIYNEAGMGCTGPVVMVAREDQRSAEKILKENKFL
ncbi:MAG: glycine reductase [Spirochaetales bacterium]|nr:glycine reductase [Spirochaetales bacterium]